MGATMRSTVRNAARLAVYEEIRIKVKNHHTLPTILPETDLLTHETQKVIIRVGLRRKRHLTRTAGSGRVQN
jgi:hypothetical protein